MQDQVRKELKTLCLSILQSEESSGLQEQVEQCQALLQKLYVAAYLKEQNLSRETGKMPFAEDEVHFVEKKQEEPPEASSMEQESLLSEENATTEELSSSTESKGHTEVPETQKPLTEDKVHFIEKKQEEPQEDLPPPITTSQPDLELADFVPADPQIAPKGSSLNQRLAKGSLNFGLNDRIAFVKHLFGDNMNDFNRVVSQLNTFEDFEEAEHFIEQMVKPDYDWQQKEAYEMRFMNRLRQRFGLEEME